MASLVALIDHDIPEGRKNLENSCSNLERVAAYCEANYLQSSDKKLALEDTKRYAVQSLASVAYQINSLASNLLQMLDLQTEKIMDMESQVYNIAQIVDIHKEKVERREIGVLTANKSVTRQHKIIAPAQQEKPQKYVRRPIDYSILDDLGHGVKLQSHNTGLLARTNSTISKGSSTGKEYKVPVTIAPPTAPAIHSNNDYGYQRYPGLVQISQSSHNFPQNSSYSAVNIPVRPAMQFNPYSGAASTPAPAPAAISNMRSSIGHMAVPQQQQQQARQLSDTMIHYADDDHFAPPPAPEDLGYSGQYSPVPPPPPELNSDYGRYYQGSVSATVDTNRNVPSWVPRNYLEKVIAIYDYQAEKADELSFVENAVIYVLKKNDDGWFEGVLDGVTGLFPGNYVEPCM